jgi:branched-chain amino acid transport system substrate-binding protein
MKRIVFLIIGALLVLGLVLPGCTTPAPPAEGVFYTFENSVIVGICADIGHTTGDFNHYGIAMAEAQINAAGGINISGHSFNLSHVEIDTNEATDESGTTGITALTAAIAANSFDFLMGSFRTEAVVNYREVAMTNHKMFWDAGAATESLTNKVVTNYDRYKYWFKATPYNEFFLAKGVLKLINSVAIAERAALGLAPGAYLRAVIIAENLQWAKNEQEPMIKAGLAALNITWCASYFVGSLPADAGQTVAALANIAVTKGYNPHIIIPVYSGYNGAVYDATLASYVAGNVICPMTVGINVYEQLKAPWTGFGTNLTSPPPAGPLCKDHVILDTWADGVNYTSKTYAFLTGFLGGAEYPMYTAATYDQCFALKACLEAVGTYNATGGHATPDAMIAWFENVANAQLTTTGAATCTYPIAGALCTNGTPALSLTQASTLYPNINSGNYHAVDWAMAPHTTHDLVYGPGHATGVGAQWQWDAVALKWKKMGIWPRVIAGYSLADQYGDWGFAYDGTVATVIPTYVTSHNFTPSCVCPS